MNTDGSIFMIPMVPLRLESESCTIVWQNLNPGSTKLCIPIGFQFAKESKELTLSEINKLETEIKRLTPLKVLIDNFSCKVKYKMLLTMIDGKVCQALTETPSSSTCYICKANPKEMNE